MESSIGKTLEKLLFADENCLLSLEVKRNIIGILIQEVCDVGDCSVTEYGERLHDLTELIAATPIVEIPRVYDPNVERFLCQFFHHAGDVMNVDSELGTRMACIRFGEVFSRLSSADVDCRGLAETAIRIATSFINHGRTSQTDEICFTMFTNIQQKYTVQLATHLTAILLQILNRIWWPALKHEDLGSMLRLVELFSSPDLVRTVLGDFDKELLESQVLVSLIVHCCCRSIPDATVKPKRIAAADVSFPSSATVYGRICLAIMRLPSGGGISVLNYLSNTLLPLLDLEYAYVLADGLVRGAWLFQQTGRPEYYRATVDLVLANPRHFLKLHEAGRLPDSFQQD